MVTQERMADTNAQQLAEADSNKRMRDKDKLSNNKSKIERKIQKMLVEKAKLDQLNQAGKLGFFDKWRLRGLPKKIKRMQENSARLQQESNSIRI